MASETACDVPYTCSRLYLSTCISPSYWKYKSNNETQLELSLAPHRDVLLIKLSKYCGSDWFKLCM